MAFITLDVNKLKANFTFLDHIFRKRGIQWAVVSKLLCGNKDYLSTLIQLGINQVCDSRVSNLKAIKAINPDIETIYIKPPARRAVSTVVKYADISLNTEIKTIQLLAQEAQKQGKTHKIIIMLELGELREGIMRDDFIAFYEGVFELQHIEVVGIGTNLSCLYGVLPNHDKLIQLSLYKQLIEAKFNRKLHYVSGGSSVTIPLIFKNLLPKGINHFRVGESLFLGTDLYNNSQIKGLHADIFHFYSEIIELKEKPIQPSDELGQNVEGHSFTVDESLSGQNTIRAIMDIGLLDIDLEHIAPVDKDIEIVGASSDMIVIDLNDNKKNYKVGDLLEFKPDYIGTLKIMNSRYIEKRLK